MASRRKKRPPPNPDDFDEPDATGWHTLTDNGWAKIEHTADCPVPNSPLIGKHAEFDAKIDDWEYKFRLCDGRGRQVNLKTDTSRICNWFENGASIASAASGYHPSEAPQTTAERHAREINMLTFDLAEELAQKQQLERQLARYRAKFEQLHQIFEYYGWDVSMLQFQEAIDDGEPPPAPVSHSPVSSSMSDTNNPQLVPPPPPPFPDVEPCDNLGNLSLPRDDDDLPDTFRWLEGTR